MIKEKHGDLLDMLDEFDVVLHGCNAYHTMGAGIAGQFARRYPQVFAADVEQTVCGDRSKLGTFSTARVGSTDVLNCYTQMVPGPDFKLSAFKTVLANMKAKYSGKRIGMPMIGAGIGGGDWAQIKQAVSDILDGEDVTVVHFSK